MMKAETIQSTTIPQADHYYHDMTESHKISTHEPRQINPSPTLLMTIKKAETIQSTTVPQDDHYYYHDMTEQAPRSSQHKGSQHRKQRPKIKHPPAPTKRKENQKEKD
eukprot:scaffold324226_cov53-Attheya_sp.AAC.1